jgi:hypothetical protein
MRRGRGGGGRKCIRGEGEQHVEWGDYEMSGKDDPEGATNGWRKLKSLLMMGSVEIFVKSTSMDNDEIICLCHHLFVPVHTSQLGNWIMPINGIQQPPSQCNRTKSERGQSWWLRAARPLYLRFRLLET